MRPERVLFDTNLLVYAFSNRTEEPKMEISKRLLVDGAEGKFELYLSVQNFSEFSSVLTRRYKIPSDEISKALGLLENVAERVFYIFPETVRKALEIQKKFGVDYWDAQIIAVMLENHVHTIYTENEKDFKKVPDIKVTNPFKAINER